MRVSAGLGVLSVVLGSAAQAQDSRASPALPSFPQVYETADLTIRVEKLADGLANPWSLAWLPNGDLLITERPGRLRVFRNGAILPPPFGDHSAELTNTSDRGLLGIAVQPSFPAQPYVYLL